MKRKHLTETPVCPRECLVIINYTTGLSIALERIGPRAAITITVFYLLILYLFALSNSPENLFASIYSESLIKTTYQHLLLLIGFNILFFESTTIHPYTCGSSDAWEVFPLSTGFWLARLGSKHKSCMKQTNIYVIENNHANFLESTNDLSLRILMFMSKSWRKAEMMYLQVFPSFLLKPQGIVATDHC
jgi:hypothetical protein